MSEFYSYTVSFTPPEFLELKQQFISSAEITKNGTHIAVGESSAQRQFRPFAFIRTIADSNASWRVRSEPFAQAMPGEEKYRYEDFYASRGLDRLFNGKTIEAQQNSAIDYMATREAHRNLPDEAYLRALKSALTSVIK